MGVVQKMQRPTSFPGRTVWGKVGECVFVGNVLPATKREQGVGVYLSETESREVLAAWGWPRPEEHTKVVEERDALAAEVERLHGLCTELERSQVKVVPIADLAQLAPPTTATKTRVKAAA